MNINVLPIAAEEGADGNFVTMREWATSC